MPPIILVEYQMLGTADFIDYVRKYDLPFNTSVISTHLPRKPWGQLVEMKNVHFATTDALDLLSLLLV